MVSLVFRFFLRGLVLLSFRFSLSLYHLCLFTSPSLSRSLYRRVAFYLFFLAFRIARALSLSFLHANNLDRSQETESELVSRAGVLIQTEGAPRRRANCKRAELQCESLTSRELGNFSFVSLHLSRRFTRMSSSLVHLGIAAGAGLVLGAAGAFSLSSSPSTSSRRSPPPSTQSTPPPLDRPEQALPPSRGQGQPVEVYHGGLTGRDLRSTILSGSTIGKSPLFLSLNPLCAFNDPRADE